MRRSVFQLSSKVSAFSICCALAMWTGIVRGETHVTGPMTLNENGEYYRLINDIHSVGTAFTIVADNVIIDLNGYQITYDNGESSSNHYGIDINASRVTIKDGVIVQGSGKSTDSCGINIRKGNGHEIYHMIIKTDGRDSQGIYGACYDSEIHHCFVNCQSLTDNTDGQGAECIRVVADTGGLNIYDNILVKGHRGISMGSTGSNSASSLSWVYNNLIQHDRIQNCKSPYGLAVGRGQKIRFHDNQIITDQGRGIMLDGLAQGTDIGAINNEVYDNRVDVQYSLLGRTGGGSYPSINLYGIRSRYSSYGNVYSGNIVLVDNNVGGRSYGFYIGSDSADPLMDDISIENNTVIARDTDSDAQRTVCFAWGYANKIECVANSYSTDEDVQRDIDGGNVSNLTFTGNTEIIPSNYIPEVPTGLYLVKFLNSYLLRWDDNFDKGESQTYEYIVYRDGQKLPISPRGGTFYVDVDVGGTHTYSISALTLSGEESSNSPEVSTTSAENGWWEEEEEEEETTSSGGGGRGGGCFISALIQ